MLNRVSIFPLFKKKILFFKYLNFRGFSTPIQVKISLGIFIPDIYKLTLTNFRPRSRGGSVCIVHPSFWIHIYPKVSYRLWKVHFDAFTSRLPAKYFHFPIIDLTLTDFIKWFFVSQHASPLIENGYNRVLGRKFYSSVISKFSTSHKTQTYYTRKKNNFHTECN